MESKQNLVNANPSLNELATTCHNIALSKGFWRMPLNPEEAVLKLATAVSLIASEAFEALDALRNQQPKEDLQEELADVIIRTFDVAAYLGMDIDGVVNMKINKNRSRPYKHGKAF